MSICLGRGIIVFLIVFENNLTAKKTAVINHRTSILVSYFVECHKNG